MTLSLTSVDAQPHLDRGLQTAQVLTFLAWRRLASPGPEEPQPVFQAETWYVDEPFISKAVDLEANGV
eukprot:CAMPEP_0181398016 /NCGR_PEP_ID=MMETSP1110-20121109/806_1 /TAXON_ID=174948 /ORGANISM="Symbiodinium sp., Strain CCMP421" /LENGTH=67 /DNA_ID=CAMNT_0023519919 /DNA_START=453 /DNA_END=660 /DNA_ORIENTATION=+